MIHTLEAFDAAGTVYAFADLIKRCASLKQDRWLGFSHEASGRPYWLLFPDEGPTGGRVVYLRKRDQAAVSLERARAAWARIPVLGASHDIAMEPGAYVVGSSAPLNLDYASGPAPWRTPGVHTYSHGQRYGRAVRFTDALRRPREPFNPDRYDKDVPGRVVAQCYEGKLHENMAQMHKAATWEVLRQRFADDLAKLGPRINKL